MRTFKRKTFTRGEAKYVSWCASAYLRLNEPTKIQQNLCERFYISYVIGNLPPIHKPPSHEYPIMKILTLCRDLSDATSNT
jgi:hypothetical protein